MTTTVPTSRDELIGWLRSTTPDHVVEETVARLRAGVPVEELWAAASLTAARYVSNQARNLLGFVSHAMIGCEDARQAARGQTQQVQELLLIQAVAQVVADLHDPCFAPYELVEFWPEFDASPAENVRMLRSDVRFGEWMRADHRVVGLEQQLDRDVLIDLLLDIGLEGMVTDDHTLITPALSLDMMELTGWDDGFPMLRATLRYSCTFPRDVGPYDRAAALVEEFGLDRAAAGGTLDQAFAGSFRDELLAAAPADRPRMVADALANRGCSPDTALAAVSLAGCALYLQVDPVPHGDFDAVSREVAPIHLGTTTNILRANLRRMAPRTAALAAVMGGALLERGPSVLSEDFAFVPFEPSRAYPYEQDVVALRGDTPGQLLKTVEEAMFAQDCRLTTAAVRAFADAGGAAPDMIATLTRVACTDDGTLMHNVKHLHAMVEEFHASTHPDRFDFLVAAAKWISWYAGKDTGTHDRAIAALAR